MVKKPTAMRITPFKFTDEQRDSLALEWKRASDQKKAKIFIMEAEQEIERWITFKHAEARSSAGIQRDAASKIKKAASKLQAAISDMPSDVFSTIDTMMRDKTSRPHMYPQHRSAAEYLRTATGKERVNLYQMTDILTTWLPLLEEAAGGVAALTRESGEDKRQEKQLIFTLSQIYEKHFNKIPSYANNSSFRKFLSSLTQITGYDFGRIVTKEALNKSKC